MSKSNAWETALLNLVFNNTDAANIEAARRREEEAIIVLLLAA